MSDLAFRKRFRSSYDSSSSMSLPVRKRYRGTSELILDTDSEKDKEVEEILDSDSESEDAEDEGEEEAVPEGQQRANPVVGTAVSESLGLRYEVLRRRELALKGDHVYSTFKVGQGFGSAPEPERSDRVSASRQPTLAT
nr:hypothetical protein [Tanacetum cinerariifolium]